MLWKGGMNASLSPARSASGRAWQLAVSPVQWRTAAALGQQSGLPGVVAQLLVSRGITEWPDIESFLSPRLDTLPGPVTLKVCTRAAQTLADAIQSGTLLAIFGDYDVDGTCATALATRYLRAVGANPVLYIPDRLTEGYGPTPAAMEVLAKQAKILLTVDTGTCAPAALQRAAELGLSVIVTDHHQPESQNPADLPPCTALVNPHRPDDTSGLTQLCGSGVVFFVLMALNRELRNRGYFTEAVREPRLTQLLDMVALATVADVMPLTGVNRVLVAKGLQQLGTWQHRGLAALAGVAGVKETPTATTLGFHLGPRLNAAGRIESARLALDLLLSDDDTEAQTLAQRLDATNRQRRELEQQVLAQAIAQAESFPLEDTPVLVLHGAGWHPGVVGIVASRIKERFNRPAFVLGEDEGGLLKGSGRGLAGLNLGDAVHASKAHLSSGGGHAMAAGLTLPRENLTALSESLKAHLWGQINANPAFDATLPLNLRLIPSLMLDAVLTPAAITPKLAETLERLAPYGQGHPEPMLALTGCSIAYCKPVGSTAEHLKLSLTDATGARLEAICFGAAGTPLGQLLSQSGGKPLAVAGHLRSRMFNGRTYVDFQVKDAHPSWAPPQDIPAAA